MLHFDQIRPPQIFEKLEQRAIEKATGGAFLLAINGLARWETIRSNFAQVEMLG